MTLDDPVMSSASTRCCKTCSVVPTARSMASNIACCMPRKMFCLRCKEGAIASPAMHENEGRLPRATVLKSKTGAVAHEVRHGNPPNFFPRLLRKPQGSRTLTPLDILVQSAHQYE